ASVFWETQQPGCAAAGVTPEAGGAESIVAGSSTKTTVQSSYGVGMVAMPDVAGDYQLAEVDAAALAPGSCYRYRVVSTGAPDAAGRFCTAKPSGSAFRFMAIGDTDPILGHTLPVLRHVLPEMPEFVVHTGDVNYYSSTETWAYWFTAMAPMLRAGAFFPSVGNHENETQYEPTDYADYYDRLFHQPSPEGNGDGTPKWYRFSWGGVWFHTIDTEEPYDSGSPQYMWLVASLAEVAAKPDFRFSVIFMHRNLYTLGDSAPQVDQRRALAPIFDAHKVRLVLSGHMHGYERFEVGDITYVTTAGGGGVIGDVNMNVPNYPGDVQYRVVGLPAYHAMLFDVAPVAGGTSLHGRAIDETGATIDDFTHVIP
ncbi:MAG TPA: metallophosphoesterase, partial [Polyangiaceae bacterium]|nr:metallophosphoesterase [Polyangiaceae bacterium]